MFFVINGSTFKTKNIFFGGKKFMKISKMKKLIALVIAVVILISFSNYNYKIDASAADYQVDRDYDGIIDSLDPSPDNNHFTGVLGQSIKSNVNFDMDYRWFFGDNTTYNPNLSVTSIVFASAIYEGSTLSVNDATKSYNVGDVNVDEVMSYFGMNDTKTVSLKDLYSDKHVSEVGLGYRTVYYNGEVKNVVAVIVRGTNGTIEEWSSNFDIGELSKYGSIPDWNKSENHAGFDVCAIRIMKIVSQYIADNNLNESDNVYWVTGHSRGAAIANIIGAYYEQSGKKAFTYTFATPNTTLDKNAVNYKTIFNIVNKDDFVPCLPLNDWGYTRYGRTAVKSIADSYEKEWEKLTGIFDYNPDTFGMNDTVKAMANIIPAGDPRVECYKYSCNCHGDKSKNDITITNRGMSKSSREKAIAKIPENALEYCIITRKDGGWISGWDFNVCQSPAYFMQILAAQMAGKINAYRFVVELNVAKRYEKAKSKIVESAIGGLEHPHYTESYYVLANHVSRSDY